MLLIAGLGNPGLEYEPTRHNVGFMLIDRLSRLHDIKCATPAGGALIGRGFIAGTEALLVKPLTYVNLSGEALRDLASLYSIPVTSMIVVHDDCDLPLGRIRIRARGGSGGHKGVESIIDCLDTLEFPRIRLGIGRPVAGELRDYVLSPFLPEEAGPVEEMLARAADAIEVLLSRGIVTTMNRFNSVN